MFARLVEAPGTWNLRINYCTGCDTKNRLGMSWNCSLLLCVQGFGAAIFSNRNNKKHMNPLCAVWHGKSFNVKPNKPVSFHGFHRTPLFDSHERVVFIGLREHAAHCCPTLLIRLVVVMFIVQSGSCASATPQVWSFLRRCAFYCRGRGEAVA